MPKPVTLFMPALATIITGCVATPDGETESPGFSEQASALSQPAIPGLPDTCFAQVDGPGGSRVVKLDLANETITETPDKFDAFGLASLGLTQNHLVACAFDTPLDILDLATGVHTQVDLPCDAATAIGDKIYVQEPFGQALTEYADLRALIAKTPSRTWTALFASRLGAGHRRLLASWHSDDNALALDLETGVTTEIPLPGHGDDWIFGLFENSRVRLVAAGWARTGLEVYSTATGAQIRRLFDGTVLQGLACTTR